MSTGSPVNLSAVFEKVNANRESNVSALVRSHLDDPRITLCSALGEVIVTIHMNGEIELSPGVELTEAARMFWEAVRSIHAAVGLRHDDATPMDARDLAQTDRDRYCNAMERAVKDLEASELEFASLSVRSQVSEVIKALRAALDRPSADDVRLPICESSPR